MATSQGLITSLFFHRRPTAAAAPAAAAAVAARPSFFHREKMLLLPVPPFSSGETFSARPVSAYCLDRRPKTSHWRSEGDVTSDGGDERSHIHRRSSFGRATAMELLGRS